MSKSTEMKNYEYLKELFQLLCCEMTALQEDHRIKQLEVNYLRAYIRWKHLEDEYTYFAQNAYEAQDEDMPFSYFTL